MLSLLRARRVILKVYGEFMVAFYFIWESAVFFYSFSFTQY